MLGTFIPQKLEAMEYLRRFPQIGNLILTLGFDNMYQGKIFQLCLWLLSISTFVCILTRWKSTQRKLFKRLQGVTGKEVKAFPVSQKMENISEDIISKVFNEQKNTEDNGLIALRISGKSALLGGMLIHIGLLAILGGGLLGVFYGFETHLGGKIGDKIVIPPIEAFRAGAEADRISREARSLRNFSPNHPKLEEYRKTVEKLHKAYGNGMASPSFRLSIKDLWVEHHKNAEGKIIGIKSWNTKLTVIDGANETPESVLKVNQPFSYKGISFFQANWSKVYSKIKVRIDLTSDDENWKKAFEKVKFPTELELKVNEPVKPDWSPMSFLLLDFYPDFKIKDGRFFTVSNSLRNPVGRIVAYDSKGAVAGKAWVFPPHTHMMDKSLSNLPFKFAFASAEPEFETGLQVAYDPGKPIVWLGCILFTIGMIMSFYIAYIEEWLYIDPNGRATLAVYGNRPVKMLEEYLEQLTSEIELINKENTEKDIT
jgi:cytochrome c biogenesis protein